MILIPSTLEVDVIPLVLLLLHPLVLNTLSLFNYCYLYVYSSVLLEGFTVISVHAVVMTLTLVHVAKLNK